MTAGCGHLESLLCPRVSVLKPAFVVLTRPQPTTCDSGWWGCEQNAIDRGVTNAVVVAPIAAGLVSHLFTLVACPAVAVHALRSAESHSQLASQDLVIYAVAQLVTIGANSIAKDGFQRQRPCYYYGRSSDTESGIIEPYSSQEWKSFWSGDTSMAWSFVAAAVALLHLRARTAVAQKIALRGGALATIGSLLRIVGFMHWLSDVVVGVVCGCLCGVGVPLLLWRVCGEASGAGELENTLGDREQSDTVP